jgi:NitT/TauT family transport system ATP-binding protein
MTGLSVDIRGKSFLDSSHTGSQLVLGDVRFSAKTGEFLCVVGPSGCGKTTMLNIVAGLDTDFKGRVKLPRGHAQLDPVLGYVFQNPRLLPWRTVEQNIRLALRDPRGFDEIIERLLAEMGIEETRGLYPNRLSLGMSRRVSLARAFAVEPDLLLMDEPFVSLDEPVAKRLRRLLLRIWKLRPTTVLFVTHDLREAIRLADRILFLSASPTMVIEDIEVGLAREAREDEEEVEDWRKQLLARHPHLFPEG